MGHKYYFATFEYFRVGRHKSWHKSRDPHFSLPYKWETLFNTFQNNLNCASALNFVMKLKLMKLKLTETGNANLADFIQILDDFHFLKT